MSISTTIKSIQDIMRKDAGVDGDAQRIGQLAWLLFLKIFDAQEEELELRRDDYRCPIPDYLLWRNWAADPEGITGDALLEFVNDDLFPTLKRLPAGPDRNQRGFVAKEAFADAFNYMKNGTLLRQVINKIEQIDFHSLKDRAHFGDIYEQLLRNLQSAGNAGEFYTPRAVTRFMVDMLDPRLGEKILDPACGTGGFLTGAIEHVRRQYVKTVDDEATLQRQIHGYEKKQLPHLLCTTNLLLHGIEVPTRILHDNTLARPLRDWGPRERVDVIVTNPPFGGMEQDGTELNFPQATRTRETADLFLQLILHLLQPTGRAAVVLPDGTLFGEGVKTKIKEKLLDACNLHTIVRLPNGVFAPYTGIKTNLLFFTKGEPTREVWYYEHPYPPGYKSYSKTKPIRSEEFDAEKAWWHNRQENEHAWRVSIDQIKAANYNLDFKNPHQGEVESHDPDELLAQYHALQAEIARTREELRNALHAALTSAAGAER
jgi:type I restriction enzyme M protein